MPKFLRGHMARQEVEFSKSFTYQPQWMEFTQPQLPLLRLLCEIFTTIEPAERAGYKLVADARMLPIPPLMMTRLLRILSACPFRLAIGEREYEIEEITREALPLRASLDTAGRDIKARARAWRADGRYRSTWTANLCFWAARCTGWPPTGVRRCSR